MGQEQSSLAAETSETTEATASQTDNPQTTGGKPDFSAFSEDDRKRLTRFKTYNDVAKSYLALETRLGASVVIPSENAPQADWDAFHKRLGRPESPDGYEFDPIYLPDGSRHEGGNEAFKNLAFNLGLSKKAAKDLYRESAKLGVSQIIEVQKKQEAKKEEAKVNLKKDWADSYDKNMGLQKLATSSYAKADSAHATEWIEFLNEGAGNDPRLLRFLSWMGSNFEPDTLDKGRGAPRGGEVQTGQLPYDKSPELNKRK